MAQEKEKMDKASRDIFGEEMREKDPFTDIDDKNNDTNFDFDPEID
jgi:hypothetical protein